MKVWYKSKLIWVGLITLGYVLANIFGVNAELTPGTLETALGVIVVILRLFTGEQITFDKNAD